MNARDLMTGLTLGVAAVAIAAPALAQTAADKAKVDQAKAAGTVGEQSDGFLGYPTGSADADTRAAVSAINAGRAQLYRDAAARNGVSPDAAGASAFAQEILPNKVQPGQYYRGTDGVWKRK